MPYVIVQFKGEETHRHEFDGPITIGRELGCEIWLADPKLSRSHCRIGPDDQGRWTVWDLNSRNGLYLRDLRVKRFIPRNGESFVIGNTTVTFHSGPMKSKRPATPLMTHHESLMTPVVGPVSDHAAPAQAATRTRFSRRPPPTPRPNLTAEPNEPLTKPFSLAFQRPAPRPILEPATPDTVMAEKPTTDSSRSWFSAFFGKRAS